MLLALYSGIGFFIGSLVLVWLQILQKPASGASDWFNLALDEGGSIIVVFIYRNLGVSFNIERVYLDIVQRSLCPLRVVSPAALIVLSFISEVVLIFTLRIVLVFIAYLPIFSLSSFALAQPCGFLIQNDLAVVVADFQDWELAQVQLV